MKKFMLLSVLAILLLSVPSVQAQNWCRPGGWGNYGFQRGVSRSNYHGWNHRQVRQNRFHNGWNNRAGAWGHRGFNPGQNYGPRGVAYNNYHTPYGWR